MKERLRTRIVSITMIALLALCVAFALYISMYDDLLLLYRVRLALAALPALLCIYLPEAAQSLGFRLTAKQVLAGLTVSVGLLALAPRASAPAPERPKETDFAALTASIASPSSTERWGALMYLRELVRGPDRLAADTARKLGIRYSLEITEKHPARKDELNSAMRVATQHLPWLSPSDAPVFSGVNLSSISLFACDIRSWTISQSDLRDARLVGCRLAFTDFRDSNLTDAVLAKSDLRHANFAGSVLDGSDLRSCNMSGVRWKGILSIRGARLQGVQDAPPGFLAFARAQGAVL
ncbi:MAG: hypothetical protein A49_11840 [Methyloceanibacter sp.]|nr:MAG: hypothetical protein A49_11840 [Methyloceanibacter sp.]